jgi:hypothetical protein
MIERVFHLVLGVAFVAFVGWLMLVVWSEGFD